MNLDAKLLHLDVDGWCVIPEVIPTDKIGAVRESVEATVATQARGMMSGTEGVASTKGLISFNQSFAPYLAEERVLGAAEAHFGPTCASPLPPPSSTIRGTLAARGTPTGPSTRTTPGISRTRTRCSTSPRSGCSRRSTRRPEAR